MTKEFRGVRRDKVEVFEAIAKVESMIEICRDHSRHVKRWRDGQMVFRWCAAGTVKAGKQFRRVNGHLHLVALSEALEQQFQEAVAAPCEDEQQAA